ncbi:superoxide dismutase [Anaerotignum sp.]|uniref:superoxide dismutase n=1 Tax=Anaerotignum sp. TaxID=2039241 RepID=UPI0028B13FED|nr:superoxide dismutase [Anaerotignum sp.]
MENNQYPFVNLPLPYNYNALEPYIDAKTMEVHHDKHLQGYINNLNQVLKGYQGLQLLTLEQLIENADRLPKGLQAPIRNYAGGVYNHRVYFDGMEPPTDQKPRGKLMEMINSQYGSLQSFKDVFKKEAQGVFGAGYAWLVYDKGKLKILSTPNQNSPIEQGFCPIFNIDVWEHAYYLKHLNERGDYIDDWFNVVNWDMANQNYLNCIRRYY